jgi:hypothetical protein
MNYEFQLARDKNRRPDYNTITSKVIKKHIEATISRYKQWPMVLKSWNLSKEAMQQPIDVQWWVPQQQEISLSEKKGAITYTN